MRSMTSLNVLLLLHDEIATLLFGLGFVGNNFVSAEGEIYGVRFVITLEIIIGFIYWSVLGCYFIWISFQVLAFQGYYNKMVRNINLILYRKIK